MAPTTIIDRFDGEYAFLSNFYDAPITYNGLTFLNSEAAFQAQKEPARAHEFTKLTPGKAKTLGRHVTIRQDWSSVRVGVMHGIVRCKFTQHPELAKKLLETGDATLIEGNYWHDYFWGVCNGKGENHLGEILMAARQELLSCPSDKETKAERFARVAELRTNKVLDAINTLSRTSRISTYSYTEEQTKQIFDALRSALDKAEACFSSPKRSYHRFSLSDESPVSNRTESVSAEELGTGSLTQTCYCPEEMERQGKKPYLLRVREVYSDSVVIWANSIEDAEERAEELCNNNTIDVIKEAGHNFEKRDIYCDGSACTTDLKAYPQYATEETYTWDEIYVRADGCAYGDDALTAKDNARWELGCLIEEMMDFDIEDRECPEEEIDKFLNEHSELNIRFDIEGHIIEK